MFSGLRSRWTMPAACACSSAAQDLAHDRERPRRRHRARRDGVGQRSPARNSITRNSEPSGGAAEVGDGDDVRVGEAAGRLGLALEAARELFLAAQLGQQHLDREIAAHHRVLGAVHGAHAADADAADDAVALTDDDADERVGDGRAAARTERVLAAGPRRCILRSSPSSAPRFRSAGAADDVRASAGVGARRVDDGDDLALRIERRLRGARTRPPRRRGPARRCARR